MNRPRVNFKARVWLDAVFSQQVTRHTVLSKYGDEDATMALKAIVSVKDGAYKAIVAGGHDSLEAYAQAIPSESGVMANARYLLTVMADDMRSGRVNIAI